MAVELVNMLAGGGLRPHRGVRGLLSLNHMEGNETQARALLHHTGTTTGLALSGGRSAWAYLLLPQRQVWPPPPFQLEAEGDLILICGQPWSPICT
jgi:hypothetical protein